MTEIRAALVRLYNGRLGESRGARGCLLSGVWFAMEKKREKASCQSGSEARTSQRRDSGPRWFLYWELNAKPRAPAKSFYFLCWIITKRLQATMNHLTRSPGLIEHLSIYSGLLLITFSVISATPFQYNMFQGSAYSGGEPRPRNKWVVLFIMCSPVYAYSCCASCRHIKHVRDI